MKQINGFLLDHKQSAIYVAYGLLFLGAAWLAISFVLYLKQNHIIGLFITKITGNITERDELRKKNISADIKHKKTKIYEVAEKKQKKGLSVMIANGKKKINSLVFYTGLLNIPGFSTTTMFFLLILLVLTVFTLASLLRGISLGITLSIATVFFFFYGLSMIKYHRRNKLEGQLLQFINDVTSASLQYANIIDIFGVIYLNYSEPLSGALEVCYVEAKRTRNQAVAMEHLKEKFDSVQFNFIIDNFILCSRTTANYTEVATNLSDTVTIYHTSFEKKKAITQNARIELIVMFFLSMIIMFVMGTFLINMYSVLFQTSFGNTILVVLFGILLYGINIKGERT